MSDSPMHHIDTSSVLKSLEEWQSIRRMNVHLQATGLCRDDIDRYVFEKEYEHLVFDELVESPWSLHNLSTLSEIDQCDDIDLLKSGLKLLLQSHQDNTTKIRTKREKVLKRYQQLQSPLVRHQEGFVQCDLVTKNVEIRKSFMTNFSFLQVKTAEYVSPVYQRRSQVYSRDLSCLQFTKLGVSGYVAMFSLNDNAPVANGDQPTYSGPIFNDLYDSSRFAGEKRIGCYKHRGGGVFKGEFKNGKLHDPKARCSIQTLTFDGQVLHGVVGPGQLTIEGLRKTSFDLRVQVDQGAELHNVYAVNLLDRWLDLPLSQVTLTNGDTVFTGKMVDQTFVGLLKQQAVNNPVSFEITGQWDLNLLLIKYMNIRTHLVHITNKHYFQVVEFHSFSTFSVDKTPIFLGHVALDDSTTRLSQSPPSIYSLKGTLMGKDFEFKGVCLPDGSWIGRLSKTVDRIKFLYEGHFTSKLELIRPMLHVTDFLPTLVIQYCIFCRNRNHSTYNHVCESCHQLGHSIKQCSQHPTVLVQK